VKNAFPTIHHFGVHYTKNQNRIPNTAFLSQNLEHRLMMIPKQAVAKNNLFTHEILQKNQMA